MNRLTELEVLILVPTTLSALLNVQGLITWWLPLVLLPFWLYDWYSENENE